MISTLLGLKVSDDRKRQVGSARGDSEIIFLSNEPQIHQQLQLSSSLFDSDDCNVVHQVSFRLGRLEELRQIAKRIIEVVRFSEDFTCIIGITPDKAFEVLDFDSSEMDKLFDEIIFSRALDTNASVSISTLI